MTKEQRRAYGKKYMAKNSKNEVTPEHFTPAVEDRFYAKVNKTDTCWNWTGAKTANRPERPLAPASQGYGVININGRPFYAHRLSYMVYNGPLVQGLVIDHLCNNTLCVNPEHLSQVTSQENAQRSPLHSKNHGGYKMRKTHCKYGHIRTPDMEGKPCPACYNAKRKKNKENENMVDYNRLIENNIKKQADAEERIANELDYIKEMIDDGTVDTDTNR